MTRRERIELLKGTLDLLILRTLLLGPAHGHQIAKHIQQTSDEVLQVEHGSLYPALHRLEGRAGWSRSGKPIREAASSSSTGSAPPAGNNWPSKNRSGCSSSGRSAESPRDRRADTWVSSTDFAGPDALEGRSRTRTSIVRFRVTWTLEVEESGPRAARRAFGNTTLVKEDVRAEWGWPRLDQFVRDVRFGFRQIRRNLGFSTMAIATLALGIGGMAAMFSAFDTILIVRCRTRPRTSSW